MFSTHFFTSMKKQLTILFTLILCSITTVFAQKKIETSDLQIFGVAVSVADSVVYMTDIQSLEQVRLEKKTTFLVDRKEYSRQLSEYISNAEGQKMTTLVSYNKKKKKLEKRYLKIKQRYTKDGFLLKYINKNEFAFTPVKDEEE